MSDVTRVLSAIEQGDDGAAEQLLPLVYEELRALAAQKMALENPGQTLDATSLVHEAYIKLVDVQYAPNWQGRRHFFSAAAHAMQRVLVDRARAKARIKRGGMRSRVDFASLTHATELPPDHLLALHEAIERLATEDETAADLVRILYFTGLSVKEAAETLEISSATAYRHWAFARAWLHCELKSDGD